MGKRGPQPGSDGARRRVEKLKERYGENCFLDWASARKERDPECYVKLGEKGGPIGGSATLAKYGHEHYVEIGNKSAQKRKEMRENKPKQS